VHELVELFGENGADLEEGIWGGEGRDGVLFAQGGD
jgi:hypothetical protein